MHFTVVSGSHRKEGQSLRVAAKVCGNLTKLGHTSTTIDLSLGALPEWDESVWKGDPKWAPTWWKMEADLKSADGLVIISPEYHGMAPAALKNFFLFLTGGTVAHKPALLVGVSAGSGGAYPVAELRASSYKNSHIVYLPDHMIIRKVADELDSEYNTLRLHYSLELLVEYAKALQFVRSSGKMNFKDYTNGM